MWKCQKISVLETGFKYTMRMYTGVVTCSYNVAEKPKLFSFMAMSYRKLPFLKILVIYQKDPYLRD